MEESKPEVFIDAGPLIVLGRAGQLHILAPLFGKVFLTDAVASEVLKGEGRPGETAVKHAIAQGYLIRVGNPPEEPQVPASLDAGERSVVTAVLAVPGSLGIIDEAHARKHAKHLGIDVTGTIGVHLLAKQEGLVQSVADIIERLLDGGMHVSPEIVRAAINAAGEAIDPLLQEKLDRAV